MDNILGRMIALLAFGGVVVGAWAAVPVKARVVLKRQDTEFAKLIDGYYKAWTIRDGKGEMVPDEAAKLFAKDADLVFYDLAPLKYTGWSEYRTGVKRIVDLMESVVFDPQDDLKVTRHDTFAWTTDTFKVTIKPKGGDSSSVTGRHTAIWEKRDGKWLIVHDHMSVPMPE